MTQDEVRLMIERNIEELQEKIAFEEQRAKSSGKCHKKDLNKHIRSLKKELCEYRKNTEEFFLKNPQKVIDILRNMRYDDVVEREACYRERGCE